MTKSFVIEGQRFNSILNQIRRVQKDVMISLDHITFKTAFGSASYKGFAPVDEPFAVSLASVKSKADLGSFVTIEPGFLSMKSGGKTKTFTLESVRLLSGLVKPELSHKLGHNFVDAYKLASRFVGSVSQKYALHSVALSPDGVCGTNGEIYVSVENVLGGLYQKFVDWYRKEVNSAVLTEKMTSFLLPTGIPFCDVEYEVGFYKDKVGPLIVFQHQNTTFWVYLVSGVVPLVDSFKKDVPTTPNVILTADEAVKLNKFIYGNASIHDFIVLLNRDDRLAVCGVDYSGIVLFAKQTNIPVSGFDNVVLRAESLSKCLALEEKLMFYITRGLVNIAVANIMDNVCLYVAGFDKMTLPDFDSVKFEEMTIRPFWVGNVGEEGVAQENATSLSFF